MEKNLTSNNGTVDEELLRRFFADSVHMRIADSGFSHRVMKHLQEEVPARQCMVHNLWTAACLILCVVMLFMSDSMKTLADSLHNTRAALADSLPHMSWNMTQANAVWETLAQHLSWNGLMTTGGFQTNVLPMAALTVVVLGAVAVYDMKESR